MKKQLRFIDNRRTVMVGEPSVRSIMELNVVAYNNCLKNSVEGMSELSLLMNTHPLERPDFAKALGIRPDNPILTKYQSIYRTQPA